MTLESYSWLIDSHLWLLCHKLQLKGVFMIVHQLFNFEQDNGSLHWEVYIVCYKCWIFERSYYTYWGISGVINKFKHSIYRNKALRLAETRHATCTGQSEHLVSANTYLKFVHKNGSSVANLKIVAKLKFFTIYTRRNGFSDRLKRYVVKVSFFI